MYKIVAMIGPIYLHKFCAWTIFLIMISQDINIVHIGRYSLFTHKFASKWE